MSETTGRREPSLHALLAAFGAVLIAICLVAAAVAVRAVTTSSSYLVRAGKSYEQLVLVNQLEADVNAWLLNEVLRREHRDAEQKYGTTSNDVERTLALYLASIRAEQDDIHDTGERDDQADEFAAAEKLRENFRALKAEIDSTVPALRGIQVLTGPAVEQRLASVRDQVRAIVQKEQREVAATTGAMHGLELSFNSGARILAAVAALCLLIMLVFFDRSLIAPISRLVQAARSLGEGNLEARAVPGGPRETADLARRFNEMADRIAGQRRLLVDHAGQLEATVVERTRDLQAKTDQLADIDRSRRLFFAKIGHELRTPVTVLKGEADVALRNAHLGAADLREAMRHISANADALKRRLEDLLVLARSEDGRLALRREPFDAADCARRATETASAFAASSGIRLDFTAGDGAVPLVGDQSWISQAVLALIDNAVKFAPQGGTVAVAVERTDGHVAMSVADGGPGVPDGEIGQMFDPYFQGQNAHGRGGSGLGLAVARWVCEQHGGTIRARNKPGGGFVVTMTVPERTHEIASGRG